MISKRKNHFAFLPGQAFRWFLSFILSTYLLAVNHEAFAQQKAATFLEAKLRQILNSQIDSAKYVAYVKVDSDSLVPDNLGEIPFAPLQLKIEKNIDDINLANLRYDIKVVFDSSVTAEKQQVLQNLIRDRFEVDGNARTLTLSNAQLYFPEAVVNGFDGKAQREAFERQLRDATDKARLEAERLRLEITKRELEQQRMTNEKEKINLGFKNQIDELQKKIADRTEPVAEKGVSDYFKEYQWFAVVFLVVFGGILSIFMLTKAFRVGMFSISNGIESFGTGISHAIASFNTHEEVESRDTYEPEPVPNEGESEDSTWVIGNRDYETYLKHLTEKINVLSSERNFTFVTRFTELVESKQTIPIAASILLALDQKSAKALVQDLSFNHTQRLKKHLSQKGALQAAKAAKDRTIQDFYGKIAIEEFLESPLMQLNDVAWLTKLDSTGLVSLTLELPNELRPVFLSCLNPSRVRLMLNDTDDLSRRQLVESLARIDEVTNENIVEFVAFVNQKYSLREQGHAKNNVVDPVSYLSEVMNDLDHDHQAQILNTIQNKEAVFDGLRKHFVPIEELAKLPQETVKDILEKTTDQDIAYLLFVVSDDMRQFVLRSLQALRAETVLGDLQLMENNADQRLVNVAKGKKVQAQMSRTMAKMYKEGRIYFSSESGLRGIDVA